MMNDSKIGSSDSGSGSGWELLAQKPPIVYYSSGTNLGLFYACVNATTKKVSTSNLLEYSEFMVQLNFNAMNNINSKIYANLRGSGSNYELHDIHFPTFLSDNTYIKCTKLPTGEVISEPITFSHETLGYYVSSQTLSVFTYIKKFTATTSVLNFAVAVNVYNSFPNNSTYYGPGEPYCGFRYIRYDANYFNNLANNYPINAIYGKR